METTAQVINLVGLSVPFAFAVTTIGCALALGKAVAAAMDATARQPEAAGKILTNMMAGCALIEAVALFALIFGFVVQGKI